MGPEGAEPVHVYNQLWTWRDVQKLEWENLSSFLETSLALN